MGQRDQYPEGVERDARIEVIGKLGERRGPSVAMELATATVDYGYGLLKLMATSPETIAALTAIGDESLVRAKGRLIHHSWSVGGARRCDSYELELGTIEVLVDARRERMAL